MVDFFSQGNNSAFARTVGITPQAVHDYISGRKGEPGFGVLKKIARAFPQLRMRWLLEGEGPMIEEDLIIKPLKKAKVFKVGKAFFDFVLEKGFVKTGQKGKDSTYHLPGTYRYVETSDLDIILRTGRQYDYFNHELKQDVFEYWLVNDIKSDRHNESDLAWKKIAEFGATVPPEWLRTLTI